MAFLYKDILNRPKVGPYKQDNDFDINQRGYPTCLPYKCFNEGVIMIYDLSFALKLETLFRHISETNYPSRDEIEYYPYNSIELVFDRLLADSYKESGKIDDFRRDYLDGNEHMNLKELISVIDFNSMYADLHAIITAHLKDVH